MSHDSFMRRAIELSARALHEPGTEPFGAVVVKDGRIVGEGINRSLANLDPTSHGETEAIRDACRSLGTVDLRGAHLYTSCEPCPLCIAAARIAGISRLFYAADLQSSDAAFAGLPESARFPIDVEELRHDCGAPPGVSRLPSEQMMAADALAILRQWAEARRG